jgi:hypothetical protein
MGILFYLSTSSDFFFSMHKYSPNQPAHISHLAEGVVIIVGSTTAPFALQMTNRRESPKSGMLSFDRS